MEFNKERVICIKPRTHTDFEIFLIGKKYGIPYELLIEYKKDLTIYKFWVRMEKGGGQIIATESRTNGEKKVNGFGLSDQHINTLLTILPIKVPKTKDIEKKQIEFKAMLKEMEEHKQKMINRNYNIDNIVCFNLRLPNSQIFAICQHYNINFLEVVSHRYDKRINKIWIEKETSEFVACIIAHKNEYDRSQRVEEYFYVNEKTLIPKKVIDKLQSTKPVKTPKVPKTKKNIKDYITYNKMGYEISIPSFDHYIENTYIDPYEEEIDEEESNAVIEDDEDDYSEVTIENLQKMLEKALEIEDYESAAELRDVINDMKNDK